MPMYDYKCKSCEHVMEELCSSGVNHIDCPECKSTMERIWTKSPTQFRKIIPMYPGAKKIKAGYIHSHGDKNATKIQSGPGGMVNPK